MDSDTVINLNINELWQIELNDAPLAVVTHLSNNFDPQNILMCQDGIIKDEDYFNSGVLVMNLDQLRKSQARIKQGIKFRAQNPQYIFFDQNILNYCFSTQTLKLPPRFNRLLGYARSQGEVNVAQKIYHYNGQVLSFDMSDNFNRLWFSYFEKTPWFNKDTLSHINEGIIQLHVGLKDFAARMTALTAGKERGFFVTALTVAAIKKTFYVRDDEEIIPAVNQESLNKLIDSMKAASGKKIYFIFVGGAYAVVRFELMKSGFVEGKDFIDATNFLSELQGVPLNTYSFVKSL